MKPDQILFIRKFNRFYTKWLGIHKNKILGSEFSLSESRILFEIDNLNQGTFSQLQTQLDLDQGYLSRVLTKLEKKQILKKKIPVEDARKRIFSLTDQGNALLKKLHQASNEQISLLCSHLPNNKVSYLLASMRIIEESLIEPKTSCSPFIIRSHRPGDIGEIIKQHGEFYDKHYGFTSNFDGYVAEDIGIFIKNFDASKENLWIVEMDGELVGSIAIAKRNDTTAQLRWLLLSEKAQGQKLGKRLVQEAINFSKKSNYSRIFLSTFQELAVARKIYQHFNFILINSKDYAGWGRPVIWEDWELML